MKVVICEDNTQISNQITQYIERYAYMEENSIKVVLNSSNPFEVIKLIETEEVDCFFLDIDLGFSINGLDLAILIRKKYPLASIIFVTTHSKMLRLTFKYRVEALDFILKDEFEDLQESILEAVKTAYDKYEKIGQQPITKFFQLKIDEFIKNINFNEIVYFKAAEIAHKITLVTLNGQFEFYQSLNNIEENDEKFFRCHKGFVINIDNIQEIDRKLKLVRMKNGENCPIAFRRLKSLENTVSKLISQ
ncbi:response regulator transcription factor [Lysinibacillus sphaericus]|uniref:LytR/AlgR family response regulator transcription factor n=1 Tax=Lysinibacillus sphaericus TaxID=1421 RepID=UPI001E4F49AE|nr:LytTR family DNA-binding domain-containing protein [Lysinibacillus sphaericus]MCS1384863.1 LytTR family DNA-binding domain-containing protein [Lysinibacillus sphaericus]UDK98235.1 response regulator transcription factor [Lysinibacillus sphaericus]